MISNIEIIGMIAAVLTTSSFVPQVYKTFRTKNVEGVSLTMFTVLFIGIICWFIYGVYINSFSIIVANLASGILVFSMVVMRIIYRKQE